MEKYDAIFEGRIPKSLIMSVTNRHGSVGQHPHDHGVGHYMSHKADMLKRWCLDLIKD